jgi:hypothetical protein
LCGLSLCGLQEAEGYVFVVRHIDAGERWRDGLGVEIVVVEEVEIGDNGVVKSIQQRPDGGGWRHVN